jgi:hypothetical protein
MIYVAVDAPRIHLFEDYFAKDFGRPLQDHVRQITYEDLFRTPKLPRGAWIFTGLEALTGAERRLVDGMQETLRKNGLRALNPATKVLGRYELLTRLHEAGFNDFRAHRADSPMDDIRFPAFVRVAEEHDGSLTRLLHNPAELRRALLYARMRGLRLSELLVVEFCETIAADGLYRKYAVIRVGASLVAPHLQIGPHWMTKHHTRAAEPELMAEHMRYLRENPYEEWARKVFEMAHIEYGRLDFGVRDGRPQAWEINLAPSLTGTRVRGEETEERIRQRAAELPLKYFAHAKLCDAFFQIDPGELPGEVQVELPAAMVAEARQERNERHAFLGRRRRIDRIASLPGVNQIGPKVRKMFGG